jgi:hypothetical protein
MTRLIIGFIFINTLNCFSQTLHEDIVETYNFSPGKMTQDEQSKKIPLMDAFWNKVKSDTAKYINELRTELQADGNPKFFYFEAGQLLVSISKNLTDKKIVLDAILKSDLSDVDRRTLVATLNYLAKSKLNTTEVSLKILDDKEFKFFIPQHAFYFNQGYCLTYSLLPTKPEFYLEAVTQRFKQEENIIVRKSILTLLWFANSCKGNEFLNTVLTDETIQKEVVAYTTDLLNRKLRKDKYYKELNKMSFDELVKAQVTSTNRMSEEAIYELDYITKLLRQSNCRQ